MRPTVLLFDLDGTLVSTGGAGRRAIEAAFTDLFGRGDACSHLDFSGMTDRAIARSALAAIEVAPTDAAIQSVLARYVERLDEALAASRDFRVLAGVHEVLDTAARREQVAVGLGTGNIVAGARKKLAVCGLWERFAFGGFADDSEEPRRRHRRHAARRRGGGRQPLRLARRREREPPARGADRVRRDRHRSRPRRRARRRRPLRIVSRVSRAIRLIRATAATT
jgi:phosphoglycolate phosphatase-like HAD superfamily hydrolase